MTSMRFIIPGLLAAALTAGTGQSAAAASMQVAPVRLEVPAGSAAAKITLDNTGDDLINAQVRVFKWVQVKGKDQLVETRDVVASPPILKLEPGRSNVIRIVRTSKVPVGAEEAYRLFVDQIPPPANQPGLAVSFVLRYSIPVFFNGSADTRSKLSWSVQSKGGRTILTVANSGGDHARIAQLTMKTSGGKETRFGSGLIGYVLANSTARFELKGALSGARPGSAVLIKAQGNEGPVQATAKISAAD